MRVDTLYTLTQHSHSQSTCYSRQSTVLRADHCGRRRVRNAVVRRRLAWYSMGATAPRSQTGNVPRAAPTTVVRARCTDRILLKILSSCV